MHGGSREHINIYDAAPTPSRHDDFRHPYTEPVLSTTTTGGTPYGATHVTGGDDTALITQDEMHLAKCLGERLARVAKGLVL